MSARFDGVLDEISQTLVLHVGDVWQTKRMRREIVGLRFSRGDRRSHRSMRINEGFFWIEYLEGDINGHKRRLDDCDSLSLVPYAKTATRVTEGEDD